jgi:hypothetical protein
VNKQYVGFSIGNGKAISTSWIKKTPVKHDEHFDKANRKIVHTYRILNWDQ